MTPVLELSDVSKDYRGLRPLRVAALSVGVAEQIAIVGWDGPAAEVFVNLVTGTTLPDRGDVKIFGRSTAGIADSADWLAVVDRFGIVSERAVLLDQLSVIQNLAVPFTLDIEPPPDDVRERASALASKVRLPEATWTGAVADLDQASRMRVRLGRALALDPAVLLLEHVSAGLTPEDRETLGNDLRTIAERRSVATVTLTADETFGRAAATRVLTIDLATGRFMERRRSWFRDRFRR